MTLLLIYLAIAIGVSFLCSILEAVLLSITPSYIASQQADGGAFGDHLAHMKNDVDRPLSAILTLNTFAHTIGAAGVGAQAQKLWGEEYLTVISAVITLLILVGSEIIPKTLGAVYWRGLAPVTVTTLRIMIPLLWPFVATSQLLTRLLRPAEKTSLLSRTDISNVATAGLRDGVLRQHEHAIIDNLMRFTEVVTGDIMTDRERVIALQADTHLREITRDHPTRHVSRIPVHTSVDDDIFIGYVLKDEILASQLDRRDHSVRELVRPLITVRENLPLPGLYNALVEASEHIAAVIDEDKVAIGVVTMEDLIESLLGVEIDDEGDALRRKVQSAREHRISRHLPPV